MKGSVKVFNVVCSKVSKDYQRKNLYVRKHTSIQREWQMSQNINFPKDFSRIYELEFVFLSTLIFIIIYRNM